MLWALFHSITMHAILNKFSQLKAPRKMCGPFKLSWTQLFSIVLLFYIRYWNFITSKFLKFFSFATPPYVTVVYVSEYYFSRCCVMMFNIAKNVEMAITIIYELYLIYIFQSLPLVLCRLTIVQSPAANHSVRKFKFASHIPQFTLLPSPRIS
jgi:hypothetical protein